MNAAQRRTLAAVFADPVNGAIAWSRVESLLLGVGCRRVEGSGSSVMFEKDGARAYFHRPHPRKEALRYRIKDVREFLQRMGIKP